MWNWKEIFSKLWNITSKENGNKIAKLILINFISTFQIIYEVCKNDVCLLAIELSLVNANLSKQGLYTPFLV